MANISAEKPSKVQQDYFLIPPEAMDILSPTIYGAMMTIACLGLLANGITFVILKKQRPITTTVYVLWALTSSDFLSLCSAMLLSFISLTKIINPTYGRFVSAVTFPYTKYVIPTPSRISNILVAIISVERLLSIFYPLRVRQICTKHVTIACIIIAYSFVIIFSFPLILEWKTVWKNGSELYPELALTELGKFHQNFYIPYKTVLIVLLVHLPFLVVVVCNFAMIIGLYAKKHAIELNLSSARSHRHTEWTITKTLLTIAFIHLVCSLPNTIILLTSVFDSEYKIPRFRNNVYELMFKFGFLLQVINSSVNWIVYISMSKTYRGAYKKLLICRRGASHSTTPSHSQETMIKTLSFTSTHKTPELA